MKLNNQLQLIDLCVYLPKKQLLIIGDLHLGYEESVNKRGVLIPKYQFKDTLHRLQKTFQQHPITTIIINGDLKHEFGEITDTEWRYIRKFITFLQRYVTTIIIVKGNHDLKLGLITRKASLNLVTSYIVDSTLITHGNIIPDEAYTKSIDTIIIGDAHPAISLTKYPRKEIYKCFLKGSWKKKLLLVMPSYNQLVEGTDVLSEQPKSEFLSDYEDFCVIVAGEKLYDFGPIQELRKLK